MSIETAGEQAAQVLNDLPPNPDRAQIMRALLRSNHMGAERILRQQLAETEAHIKEMAEFDRSFSLDTRRIQHAARAVDMVIAAMERK